MCGSSAGVLVDCAGLLFRDPIWKGRGTRSRYLITASIIAVSLSVSVHTATWIVPDDHVTIQEAIDASVDGDVIGVAPGVYAEALDFCGKAITVTGLHDHTGAPIIECPGNFAVSFRRGETAESVLRNFVIRDSLMAVLAVDSSPSLANLTIVGNQCGIEAYGDAAHDIRNCIFRDNARRHTYQCEAH